MPRAIDLRSDAQMAMDKEIATSERMDRIRDAHACRLYPGCECEEHHTRGYCRKRDGVFFDDAS